MPGDPPLRYTQLMTEQPGAPVSPPPIAGPSRRVRQLRRFGLASMAAGFVIVMGNFGIWRDQTIAEAGWYVFVAGMALYFVATLMRFFGWKRE
ncbi:MAG: hypothetical protein EXQ85_02155 [Alphaproteobacteria bacterium]|nr:hypothetical protein [Alphaproteobacteria bacterium]